MTPLSGRHAVPALVLVLAAAVPVWLHAATGLRHETCADPDALRRVERIPGTASVRVDERRGSFSQRSVGTLEGPVVPGVPRLQFRVLRTFEPARLYSVPDPALDAQLTTAWFARAFPGERRSVRELAVDGARLRVHRSSDTRGPAPAFVDHLYVLGGRPVAHPLPAGLARAPAQLVHGTEPVAAYVVFGFRPVERAEDIDRAADAWLRDAWRHHREACGP